MFKRLLAALLGFVACAVFAADANNASQADLEAIKGIGPAIATRIVDERSQRAFKDWPDLVNRVKGVGHTGAGKLSTAGLTVNGAPYAGAPAPAAKTTAATATAPTPARTIARTTTAPDAASAASASAAKK
jgi:competence protein ComEA